MIFPLSPNFYLIIHVLSCSYQFPKKNDLLYQSLASSKRKTNGTFRDFARIDRSKSVRISHFAFGALAWSRFRAVSIPPWLPRCQYGGFHQWRYPKNAGSFISPYFRKSPYEMPAILMRLMFPGCLMARVLSGIFSHSSGTVEQSPFPDFPDDLPIKPAIFMGKRSDYQRLNSYVSWVNHHEISWTHHSITIKNHQIGRFLWG